MLTDKNFSSLIDECLSWSSLPVSIVSLLREELQSYYSKHLLFSTDEYPEAITKLYGYEDDKFYSLISLCFVEEYSFLLLPSTKAGPFGAQTIIIERFKKEFDYSGIELGNAIREIIATIRYMDKIITSSTRTKRQALEGKNQGTSETFEWPEVAVLKRFYECGRKVAFDSREEVLEALEIGTQPYQCDHCHKWHQGRQSAGEAVPESIVIGRYRTAWRRYQGI